MTDMTDRHEPDPRFIDGLAGQLARELRRRNRTRDGRGARIIRTAGLVVVSVAAGAVAMGATQQMGESWRRELAEARLTVELQSAEQALANLRESQRQIGGQVERGLRVPRELAYTEYRVAEAEGRVRIAELKLNETRHSGREPQDALSAPLVDSRDYVSERIRVRMEVARRHVDLVRQESDEVRRRVEAGVVRESESDEAHLVVREAELDIATLTREIELRQSYLDSEMSAVEAELNALEVRSRNRVELLELKRRYFESQLATFERAIQSGSMSLVVSAELRTQLSDVVAELDLATAELRIVRTELERRAAR
jgi:hypothetical protein